MTADIKLLPLPAWLLANYRSMGQVDHEAECKHYARANVAHATAAKDAEIEALRGEVEKLRELCGCAYQMAGYHDAPVEWLDALGDAGDGTPLDEWRVQAKDLSDVLLPYQPDNSSHEDAIEAAREDAERLDAIKQIRLGVAPIEGGGWDVYVYDSDDGKETLIGSGADIRRAIDTALEARNG